MASPKPTYDVVIVTYNCADVIGETLAAAYAAKPAPAKVIVVDCASADDTVATVRRNFPQVTLLPQKDNLGFGKGNMIGFKEATADYVLLVNPDLRVEPGCPAALLAEAEKDPELAAVSPLIYEGWGKEATVYGYGALLLRSGFGINLVPGMPHEPNCFTGACALLRREVAQKYGFEPSYFLYYEEAEAAARLLKDGWRFGRTDQAAARHLAGHSGPKEQAQALGFRQFYGIQNRWFALGAHWPVRALPAALGANLLHLASFALFYARNRQGSRLSILWLAPAAFFRGLSRRRSLPRPKDPHWFDRLVLMGLSEMIAISKTVYAPGHE